MRGCRKIASAPSRNTPRSEKTPSRTSPAFAEEIGANPIVALAMRLLSYRIRRLARRARVRYSFLFMRPDGEQLREIASRIDAGIIRPVVDRVFPFESTKDALAYVESGRAKVKVIVKVR
jgi:alcohol dehydrogenase